MMTRQHFKHFVFYPFAAVTGLVTAIWFATPYVAQHYLTAYLNEQGKDLSVGALSIDFFPPKIDVKNIVINDKTHDTLSLKRATFGIEFWPLFTKTVHISEANIEGLHLTVAQKEKNWIVAGINTTQFIAPTDQSEASTEEENSADTASTPWSITLPEFTFRDGQVSLSRQADLNTPVESDTVILKQLRIEDLSGQGLTWQGNIAASVLVNEAEMSLDSQFDYSPEQANANIDITDTRLMISSFKHFLPAPYNTGSGLLDLNASLLFSLQSVNNRAVYDIKNLTLDTKITDLTLPLGEQDRSSTKSTSLQLSQANLRFVSADQLTATGTMTLDSTQSSFAQEDRQAQLDKLTLNLPFDVSRDTSGLTAKGRLDLALEKPYFAQADLDVQLATLQFSTPFDVKQSEQGITATGDLITQLGKSRFAQASQHIVFDDLALKTPFTIKQDKESGLNANLASTTLDVNTLALSLDSLAVQNKQLHIALKDVDVAMDPKAAVSASLFTDIQSNGLAVQQAGNTAHYDVFTLSNTLSLTKSDDALSAQNDQLKVAIEGVNAKHIDEKQVSLGAATLTAKQLDFEQKMGKLPRITGQNINFSSSALDSLLTDNKRIASWANASLNDLSFSQQGDNVNVTLTQLDLDDLTVSQILTESTKQALPSLSHVNHIRIEEVTANQDGADIKQITADAFAINLMIDAQKRIENLVFTSGADQQDATQPTPDTKSVPRENDVAPIATDAQDPAFKAPYYVVLGAYDTTGASSIYFQDRSITPTLKRSLDIETLSLRDLNSKKKDQATVFSFKARSGKYTTLKADATVWPLADKLTLQSKVQVREAELPPFSSYIANVLGYQIDSGQLDLDLNLEAKSGTLNGDSHIVLREFDLGGRQDSNSVVRAGAVPLNIAVGILKDSDNNIDLNIPLSGDINNPEFGWKDFLFLPVKKALYTASSTYLMQTFIPYANVISIAQLAGDQLLKIRVEPLIFNAEEDTLNDSQEAFLNQLTALMKDKKDSQLKACGVTSFVDLGFEKPPVSIDDETKEQARNLAQKRADHLKDYLVNEGITSSRIFLCSPEIDLSKSSKPRVELNF